MEKLCCKFCEGSFLSPRLLEVHMRSHFLLKSEEESMCRYGLRDKPRKSWRLKEKENVMVSYKHMKCHSEMRGDEEGEKDGKFEKKERDLKSNRSYEEGEDEMKSQYDSEVTTVVFPAMGGRRKRGRSSVSSPDYDNEEKMGAFCLMMLSRDAGFVLDSSDKVSAATDEVAEKKKKRSDSGLQKFDFEMNELKKAQSFPKYDFGKNGFKKIQSFLSESEFSHELPKSKASPHKKILNYAVSEIGHRRKYKCKICHMSFHSYQALGGHMASHKRIKESSFTEISANEEQNIKNCGSKSTKKSHECSICGRIFESGQALGGHMRSHLVPTNNSASVDADQASPAVIEVEQKNSRLGLLDLNLPALDDEIYDYLNGNIEDWVW